MARMDLVYEPPGGVQSTQVESETAFNAVKEGVKTEDSENTQLAWLGKQDMLPFWVPQARILQFTYNASSLGNQPLQHGLSTLALELIDQVMLVHKESPGRPLIFIGLSFGGLIVIKAFLSSTFYDSTYASVSKAAVGTIFLSTPLHDSSYRSQLQTIASIASAAGHGQLGHLEKTFEADAEFLARLTQDFARLALVRNISVHCFAESPSNDVSGYPTVDERCGTIGGFPSSTLTANHLQLHKFDRPDDPNYILIRNQIVKLAEASQALVKTHKQDASENFETYLNALFVTDPDADITTIEHNNGNLLNGSGSWLWDTKAMKDWMNPGKDELLWLHGGPGMGKTMLAISVVKNLSSTISVETPVPGVLMAYFFCDNKHNQRNSAVSVLRSLLYQILQARPDLSASFRTLYDREKGQLFSSSNLLHSLWRVLMDILSSSTLERVYFIIDALDELDETSASDILKLLDPFMRSNPREGGSVLEPNPRGASPCRSKWLFTSRNIVPMSYLLRSCSNISLESNSGAVNDTVSRYIDARVGELERVKSYPLSLAAFVRGTLREKAEGTFLYVSMACRALSQPSVRLINTKTTLANLPRGLTPLYERMFQDIGAIEDPELFEYATTILRAMVLAARPLTMSELAVAAQLPKEHLSDPEILKEYVALCGSFTSQQQDTVYFVHHTVKTYLQNLKQVFPTSSNEYHGKLASIFIDEVEQTDEQSSDSGRALNTMGYPVAYWMYHARLAGSAMNWDSRLAHKLFSESTTFRQTWLDSYWALCHPTWDKKPQQFSALHLAAYGGIKSLAEALKDRGDILDPEDSLGLTPLMWAARNGHDDVVQLLLDLGAAREAKTPDGLTAILCATIHGHENCLRLLIESQADVGVADKMGWTPLHYAAAKGNLEMVATLLAAGSNIDAKDIAQQTALQRAAFCADLSMVKFLVQQGASTKVRDKDGLTMLHLAARDGHLNLARYWLTLDREYLEEADDQEWTPLMHAAWFGHSEVTAYLIQQGADIEAKSLDGNTSLHLATWNGHNQVVKTLLAGGANPSSQSNRKETALQEAACRGSASICRLLLEADVDPNTKSEAGVTPLHQAAANGHETVVKVLLDWGADPNITDSLDQTPGDGAAENNPELAQLLKRLEISTDDKSPALGGEEVTGVQEKLDPAVCELLNILPESGFCRPLGKEGFSKPRKVTALIKGTARQYFMKSGSLEEMFRSEHEALRALHATVPSICPYSLGHGKLKNSAEYFLLMEFLDINRGDRDAPPPSGLSLPQKLAQLHSTPAAAPAGHQQPMFGWPSATFCGSTRQSNTLRASWAKFFAEDRLLAILRLIDENHGADDELRGGVTAVVGVVVPRLLRNGHLGGRRGIQPVLVHGDLWIGNRALATNPAWGKGAEEVVFDPSACYAHSEYEISIMRMFGGFSAGFFHEYHRLVPKTEPKAEYEDRIHLYELYHYLNHYLIFRGGYKDNAMDIIKDLTDKYQSQNLPVVKSLPGSSSAQSRTDSGFHED